MKKQMWVDIVYLLFLAATLGAVLVLGIFVAPVVFNSEMLDRYNEGIIMAEVFRRFTYWLYVTLAMVILYESYQFKIFKRDNIMSVTTAVTIFTILMFNTVYTPRILEMQAQGVEATQSEVFEKIHLGSEIDFKILALALLILFARRYYLITHPQR
jgi:hypothetical protein